MRLLRRLIGSLRPREPLREPHALIVAEALLPVIAAELQGDLADRHEGIAYLLGRTDGLVTIALAAMHPDAMTTHGSFDVSALAMAKVVRAAADQGLQVVGQLHTHPGEAFHSRGDIAGARIRYPGYVSIIVPNYGSALPSLDGATFYFCEASLGFRELGADLVHVVTARVR